MTRKEKIQLVYPKRMELSKLLSRGWAKGDLSDDTIAITSQLMQISGDMSMHKEQEKMAERIISILSKENSEAEKQEQLNKILEEQQAS